MESPPNESKEEEDIFPESELSEEILINVISRNGTQKIQTRATATIEQLKKQIVEKFRLPNKFIRLISRGRVLEDGNTLEMYSIHNNAFVHFAISESPPQSTQQQRHTNLIDDQEQPRGFDRLHQFGFSDADIEQFRQQFHLHRLANTGFLTNSTATAEQLRAFEEEWMNSEANTGLPAGNTGRQSRTNASSRSPPSSASSTSTSSTSQTSNHHGDSVIQLGPLVEEESNPYGTNEDLIKGMIMGLFLGFIMVLWLPDQSLTSRTKAGILAGVTASVFFGILRLLVF